MPIESEQKDNAHRKIKRKEDWHTSLNETVSKEMDLKEALPWKRA